MKSTDYNRETETAYSHEVIELVNPQTGEFVPTMALNKTVYGGEAFTKTLTTFYKALVDAFESTSYQVLFYMILHMRKKSNEFIGTYKTIEEETGLGRTTVIRGVKWARDNDFIRAVSTGIWMINPYMIATGDNLIIRKLRDKYNKLERSK